MGKKIISSYMLLSTIINAHTHVQYRGSFLFPEPREYTALLQTHL